MSEPTPSDADIETHESAPVEDAPDREPTVTSDGVTSWPPAYRSRRDVLVLPVVVVAFWTVAGGEGALVGVALAATRLFLPTIVVYALGYVAATAIVPARGSLASVALPVAALTVLLLTTSLADDWTVTRLAVVLAAAGVTVVALAVFLYTEAVWLAGVAVAAVAAAGFVTLAAYGLAASAPGGLASAIPGRETTGDQ